MIDVKRLRGCSLPCGLWTAARVATITRRWRPIKTSWNQLQLLFCKRERDYFTSACSSLADLFLSVWIWNRLIIILIFFCVKSGGIYFPAGAPGLFFLVSFPNRQTPEPGWWTSASALWTLTSPWLNSSAVGFGGFRFTTRVFFVFDLLIASVYLRGFRAWKKEFWRCTHGTRIQTWLWGFYSVDAASEISSVTHFLIVSLWRE